MSQELLTAARQALASKQKQVARTLLMQVVRADQGNGEAWHLLSEALDDPAQQADCRKRAQMAGYTPVAPAPPVPAPVAVVQPVAPPAPPVAPQPTAQATPAPAPVATASSLPIARRSKAAVAGAVVTAVLLLSVIGAAAVYGSPRGLFQYGLGAVMAHRSCEAAMRPQMTSPASARFFNRSITREGEAYNVAGAVEGQNALGVALQTGYRCTVVNSNLTSARFYTADDAMQDIMDDLNNGLK